MAFFVRLLPPAKRDLKSLRVFDQWRIVDAMEEQLKTDPPTPTRNRKPIEGAEADFEHDIPLWELRCGEFRVFYDVNHETRIVMIRAIRRKDQGQTTQKVLHERGDT